MLLKILSKIILRNFTKKVTNLVLPFSFITNLFNQTNSNKKQKPLELSLARMSAVISTSSCSKKEYRGMKTGCGMKTALSKEFAQKQRISMDISLQSFFITLLYGSMVISFFCSLIFHHQKDNH